MASAEHLLHEAQYAFNCITFGESRENSRNAARAESLCRKIIRKYPDSMEAGESHAILRRLGEEAYTSKMRSRHRHIEQSEHHRTSAPANTPEPRRARKPRAAPVDGEVAFDWSGLIAWLVSLPKAVLGTFVFGGLLLFGILGPFIFLPLIGLILFTGPGRQMLKSEQRENLNGFVVRANAFIAKQRETRGDFL